MVGMRKVKKKIDWADETLGERIRRRKGKALVVVEGGHQTFAGVESYGHRRLQLPSPPHILPLFEIKVPHGSNDLPHLALWRRLGGGMQTCRKQHNGTFSGSCVLLSVKYYTRYIYEIIYKILGI